MSVLTKYNQPLELRRFLKEILQYLNGTCDSMQQPTDEMDGGEQEATEYMNIFNQIDEKRSLLIEKCERLLEECTAELGEENSYLEMGRGRCTKESEDSIMENAAENNNVVNFEESCYDFTSDSSLYDDCMINKSDSLKMDVIMFENEETSCPYNGLPAAHLKIKQSPKYGCLFKQEKRLFFDPFKKYYGGLLNKWLLLYNNSTDLKPIQCIQIKDIAIDLSLNEHINVKNLFQVITSKDTRVQFQTSTFKELNEWIVNIQNNLDCNENTIGFNANLRKLPSPPPPPPPSTAQLNIANCETIFTSADYNQQNDGIYEEPAHLMHTKSKSQLEQNYDTPKKSCNDHLIDIKKSPPTSSSPSSSSSSASSPSPLSASSSSPSSSAASSTITSPATTPVKNWIFNRFNKSPPSSTETKQQRKGLKKLSLPNDLSHQPPSHSLSTPTTPKPISAITPFAINKGTKINMIISQLEANGQLNLLSKSLNDQKRNTFFFEHSSDM